MSGCELDACQHRGGRQSCHARADTVCWGFDPRTTLRPYRAGTGAKPTVSSRVRVMFLVSFSVQPI